MSALIAQASFSKSLTPLHHFSFPFSDIMGSDIMGVRILNIAYTSCWTYLNCVEWGIITSMQKLINEICINIQKYFSTLRAESHIGIRMWNFLVWETLKVQGACMAAVEMLPNHGEQQVATTFHYKSRQQPQSVPITVAGVPGGMNEPKAQP